MSLRCRFIPLCLLTLAAFTAVFAPARDAHATFNLEFSVGAGGQVSPLRQYEATNLMVTPGLGILENILRFELGVVGSFAAITHRDPHSFDLELRPMVVVSPPVIPLYLRVIFAGVDLFSPKRTIAYGGALGVGISAFGLGIFAELGVLPRVFESQFQWLLEGRAGVALTF